MVGGSTTYTGPVTRTTYDLAGRVTATAQCTPTSSGGCGTPVLATTSHTYDGAGRPLQTTSPQGRPTTYSYDAAGPLTAVTQRVTPADPGSAITVGLGYDPAGNAAELVDGAGNATVYTYNAWGLPESTIEPSTSAQPSLAYRTWTTGYDADGRAVSQQVPGGVTRTTTYDNLGRPTSEVGSGAAAATTGRTLDYDALGRVTSASSPAGALTYTWSDRGLLIQATGYGGTATYSYDGAGALTARTDAAGASTYGYDAAGRLTTIGDPVTGTTATLSYDNAGRLTGVGRGSGYAARALTYDNLGRVATDTTSAAGTSTVSASYGYDLDGLLTARTTTGVTGADADTYAYDGLGRVTTWTATAGTTTYGYDAASNRTGVTTSAGTRAATFDERDRLVGVAGADGPAVTLAYNPAGQLTTVVQDGQTQRSYGYDAFERLVSMAGEDVPSTTYSYDSLDRVAQRDSASFGYADLSNDAVLDPSAAGEVTLLRDPTGQTIATKTGGSPGHLVVNDAVHLDTVATLDPATGVASASASYDPWGVPTAGGGALPGGYQGGYTDPETGLVNAASRWYDPALATFTSRDTLGCRPCRCPRRTATSTPTARP